MAHRLWRHPCIGKPTEYLETLKQNFLELIELDGFLEIWHGKIMKFSMFKMAGFQMFGKLRPIRQDWIFKNSYKIITGGGAYKDWPEI